MNLTPKQQEIVNFAEGSLLVTACPGSGKTLVLTERIKKLLLSTRRGKILAVTFSNKAAMEMKTRLKEDNSVAELLDKVTVGTLHAFCLELVLSRYHNIGLPADLMVLDSESDRRSVLQDIFLQNPILHQILQNRQKNDKFLSCILNKISMAKREFIQPNECENDRDFALIYKEYNSQLLSQNWLDYDDILFFTYRILTECTSVAEIYQTVYRYICIDEAQDLNYAQYQVIKALCGDRFKNVMMVGDARQSIYGFNGSSSSFMTNDFARDFQPTTYELNENFRSAKAIVEFANTLGNSESITNYPYQGELIAKCYGNEDEEANGVIHKIQELVKNGHPDIDGNITFSRIAVIARNKYALQALEKKLSIAMIPFCHQTSIIGIESESELLNVFALSLRILSNPKDCIHNHQLYKIIGKKQSIIHESIYSLQELLSSSKYSSLWDILAGIVPENPDLSKVLAQINNLGFSCSEDERYMIEKDIEHWQKHWHEYCTQVSREYRSLPSFLNSVAMGRTNNQIASDTVSLLSAHMSKGLQFEIVFIIGLSEGTFPDYRATSDKALAEEKNNMYVAVTRAKRLCYLSYPQYKTMPWGEIKYQKPSRFIQNILQRNLT